MEKKAQFEHSSNHIPVNTKWISQRVKSTENTLAYHEKMEIQLVKQGSCSYFVADRNIELVKNTLLLIKPNEVHCFIAESGVFLEKGTLMFSPNTFTQFKKLLTSPLPRQLVLTEQESAHLQFIIRDISAESKKQSELWTEMVKLHMGKIFVLIRRAANREILIPSKNPIISWLTSYIENNFYKNLTLSALAKKAGYSSYYVSRLFKKHSGLGLKQYILQRRILEAKRLLLAENLTVNRVANKVGFNNFAVFNRCFKQLTKMTPTVYRNISHHNDN